MLKLPYTHLLSGSTQTIVISGPHIQVIDSWTGHVLHSTATNPETNGKASKSGPVRCAVVDAEFAHLVTANDDKLLRVWAVDGLTVVNEREMPKKATCVRLTKDGQTILVSDKFGDIFRYPLQVRTEPSAPSDGDAHTAAEKASGGSLLMGHASLLTTFFVTQDDKFIISADRDEHIRVSCYPQAYTIESFCLGHKKFVTAIHSPPSRPSALVSGGGDPVLKVWDWVAGEVVLEVRVLDAVMPFVKVRRPRRRSKFEDGDGDEEAEDGEGMSSRQKRKAKKGKGKGKEREREVEAEEGDDRDGSEPRREVDRVDDSRESGDAILVVHKIDSFESTRERFLLFDAVGATALFYCTYPEPSAPAPEIRHVDLEKPIIDFIQGPDGEIWVLLDGQWGEDGAAEGTHSMVKVIKFVDGQFVESAESCRAQLIASLNSANLLPATPADVKNLGLYSSLAVMPKNTEAEHSAATEHEPPDGGRAAAPSAKALGRLKRKQALQAKAAAGRGSKGGGQVEVETETEAEAVPGHKKARVGLASQQDAGMEVDG